MQRSQLKPLVLALAILLGVMVQNHQARSHELLEVPMVILR